MYSSPFDDFPAELIDEILLFSTAEPLVVPGPDQREGESSLPCLKKRSNPAVTLSHVCSAWRDRCLKLSQLWNGIYLDSAICSQEATIQMILDLLVNRHGDHLHLDVECQVTSVSITSILPVWKKILSTQIFPRCRSLRLRGTREEIQFCIDVLLASKPQSSFPLRGIELIWSGCPTVLTLSPHHQGKNGILLGRTNTFNFSNLRFIRSNGLNLLSHDPQVPHNVEELVLTNTTGRECLDAIAKFQNVRKLTFRDVELHGQTPEFDSEPLSRQIEYLELGLLVPRSLYPWGNEDAATFYVDILLNVNLSKTLKTFKMGSMSQFGWVGWVVFSNFLSDSDASFPHVKTLILDDICSRSEMAQQDTSRLQRAFPNAEKLILNATKYLEGYVMQECRSSGLVWWPSVREVQCGELHWNRNFQNGI
ncbi:hypothetical protein EST38_g4941 [Candolleomyces aberdarensis]|uniref:F-box domain-containing protein n=1 Tax=Candolleomyces aberdarensis TaxID=2316362 RepID=A0A4Q2DLS8_9AGAR|nr:hypothetical protein EST38_g4941 [Candolleomyces aberdarensis]